MNQHPPRESLTPRPPQLGQRDNSLSTFHSSLRPFPIPTPQGEPMTIAPAPGAIDAVVFDGPRVELVRFDRSKAGAVLGKHVGNPGVAIQAQPLPGVVIWGRAHLEFAVQNTAATVYLRQLLAHVADGRYALTPSVAAHRRWWHRSAPQPKSEPPWVRSVRAAAAALLEGAPILQGPCMITSHSPVPGEASDADSLTTALLATITPYPPTLRDWLVRQLTASVVHQHVADALRSR
jgi:hypothetical protein